MKTIIHYKKHKHRGKTSKTLKVSKLHKKLQKGINKNYLMSKMGQHMFSIFLEWA